MSLQGNSMYRAVDLKRDGKIDKSKVDIWSLGAIILHSLHPLMTWANYSSLTSKQLKDHIEKSFVNGDFYEDMFKSLLLWMLDEDTEWRISAGELISEIGNLQEQCWLYSTNSKESKQKSNLSKSEEKTNLSKEPK